MIDIGSGYIKAGLSGEEGPRAVFPAIVGRPKYEETMKCGASFKAEFFGQEAYEKRGILNLNYPIKNGIVQDWDDFVKVMAYTFTNELRVEPSEFAGVILTEAPLNPKINRERLVQIMFETFGVKSTFVTLQAVMSLYAAGRTTGMVVDAGDGVIHTIPVYEGYAINSSINKVDNAGRSLTEWE